MAKAFKKFVGEMKARLLAYEIDMSCFDDYSDKEIELIKRLREVLYNNDKKSRSVKKIKGEKV